MGMVELLAGVDPFDMRPKLRAFDQRFALVRTTRAIGDLRLYRILLTAAFGGFRRLESHDLATRPSTRPDNVGIICKQRSVGSDKGSA
jgi:hypothetical protein